MNLFSGSGVRMGVRRRESSIIANEHLCSMHTLYANTLYSAYVSHLSALFIVYYCYLETI